MHIDNDERCDYMNSMNSYNRSFSCGFLFGCKGREGEYPRTVHNSNRDVLGAALAHPKEVQTYENKEIDQV